MITALASPASTTLGYLDAAANKLSQIGISLTKAKTTGIAASLLEDVKDVNPTEIAVVGKVLENIEVFSDVVRQASKNAQITNHHEKIVKSFKSIHDDAVELSKQEDKDKLSLGDKFRNFGMTVSRGSIASRFNKINNSVVAVVQDTQKALQIERVILESYMDFRGSLVSAQATTFKMYEEHKATVLIPAQKAYVEAADKAKETGLSDEEKAKRDLKRDELKREFDVQFRKSTVLERLSNNLRDSYQASDGVMGSLDTAHQTKLALCDMTRIFFSTNQNLFTTIEATLTAHIGTREATKSLNALKDGTNMGIETCAVLCGKNNESAIKAAYGANVSPDSVKKLVDALVDYQSNSYKLIEQSRDEARKSSDAIERFNTEGKARIAQIHEEQIRNLEIVDTKQPVTVDVK